MYYNVLNLLSVSEIAEMVSRCSEPSDEYMKKYIADAKRMNKAKMIDMLNEMLNQIDNY